MSPSTPYLSPHDFQSLHQQLLQLTPQFCRCDYILLGAITQQHGDELVVNDELQLLVVNDELQLNDQPLSIIANDLL